MAYPVRQSSGKIARATCSAWRSRACAMTVSALRSGSTAVTGNVHEAMRAKP